jgi:hypothetical protein
MKRCVFLCILYSVCCGCSPSSISDFRHEGESICRDIITDLENIQERGDLVKFEVSLKKNFEKLSFVLMQAREFQMNHPEEALIEHDVEGTEVSDLLLEQMQRVYRIEGGREVIERAQREAMLRLDGYEKLKDKQRILKVK